MIPSIQVQNPNNNSLESSEIPIAYDCQFAAHSMEGIYKIYNLLSQKGFVTVPHFASVEKFLRTHNECIVSYKVKLFYDGCIETPQVITQCFNFKGPVHKLTQLKRIHSNLSFKSTRDAAGHEVYTCRL